MAKPKLDPIVTAFQIKLEMSENGLYQVGISFRNAGGREVGGSYPQANRRFTLVQAMKWAEIEVRKYQTDDDAAYEQLEAEAWAVIRSAATI